MYTSGIIIIKGKALQLVRCEIFKVIKAPRTCTIHEERGKTENLVYTVTLDKINWLYECFTLNLSNVRRADLNGMEALAIYFNQKDDIVLKTKFELRVMGTTLASRREIQEHLSYASGNAIKLSSGAVKEDTVSSFIVQIKKNVCRRGPD